MSTALEAASLIMVPSGYDNGVLGSVKPTDGTGDFTFSRGSNISATRVNEDGYIEKGYENLLLRSNTFSDAAWTKSNVSVTSGQSGYDVSNDAWLIKHSSANSRHNIWRSAANSGIAAISIYAKAKELQYLQIASAKTGLDYANFDLSDGSVGNVGSDFFDAKAISVGNGWYRLSVISKTGTNSIYISLITSKASAWLETYTGANETDGLYIQDAMLNQGLVAHPYVETTTAPVAGGILEDMPRIDHSSGKPSLLLEPQRTNLVTNSEFSTGWSYQSVLSVTSNSSISPEGISNATKITKVAEGNMYYRRYIDPAIGCFSVFAKKGNWRYIGLRNNQSAGNDHSVFDFDAQTFVREASGQTCTFEDYGDGWYRLNSYQPNNESSGIYGIALTDENGAENSGVSIVPNGSHIYVYGFQVEQDATYPTSYIPTYGTSQTRLADITDRGANLSYTGDYTFFAEFELTEIDVYFLGANTSSGYNFMIRRDDTLIQFGLTIGTGASVTFTNTTDWQSLIGTTIKMAFYKSGTTFKLFINGTGINPTTNTLSTGNEVLDWRYINVSSVANRQEQVYIKRLLEFEEALSDDECIALTTI